MGRKPAGKVRHRLLAGLMISLLLFCGCQARPGTNAPSSKPESAVNSSSKGKKADKEEQPDETEKEAGQTQKENASSVPEVDPEEEAQRLLEERIGELCFYYTGNFDLPSAPNTAQVYWSVFKWYSCGEDYKAPDKPDYSGYEQLDAKTVKKLVKRWYGPNIPEYEGNLSALGDPATGELINVSENGNTYYFLEVEMPAEEEYILQNARADADGTLTIRFNAQDHSGGYLRTYLCKLKPDGAGGYYLVSLNKGQS